MKTALITGITGQSASYLAEILLQKDYKVYGMARRLSAPNDWRISQLYGNSNFSVVQGDLTDPFSLRNILTEMQPDEVYNLAAQSFVKASFDEPKHTTDVTYLGVLNLLECLRDCRDCKVFQASSSEMFGSCSSLFIGAERLEFDSFPLDFANYQLFQDEYTVMRPNSPYAIAKLAAHHLCRIYRESYGMFISCGIMFNHESPRRGEEFVTRKIAKYVARHFYKLEKNPLTLGNLQAKRDWGYARDYMEGAWMMLQASKPEDYVLATGETHSVQEFVDEACRVNGNKVQIGSSQALLRPSEVPFLRGSYEKIKRELGWEPKTKFADLVKMMVKAELQKLEYKSAGDPYGS